MQAGEIGVGEYLNGYMLGEIAHEDIYPVPEHDLRGLCSC